VCCSVQIADDFWKLILKPKSSSTFIIFLQCRWSEMAMQ
jgi:hypothetical protein